MPKFFCEYNSYVLGELFIIFLIKASIFPRSLNVVRYFSVSSQSILPISGCVSTPFLSMFQLPETGFGVGLSAGPFLTVLGNTSSSRS